ncbi:hypothetical protein CBL_12416 [Carabus blaptoides fortunei]
MSIEVPYAQGEGGVGWKVAVIAIVAGNLADRHSRNTSGLRSDPCFIPVSASNSFRPRGTPRDKLTDGNLISACPVPAVPVVVRNNGGSKGHIGSDTVCELSLSSHPNPNSVQ